MTNDAEDQARPAPQSKRTTTNHMKRPWMMWIRTVDEFPVIFLSSIFLSSFSFVLFVAFVAYFLRDSGKI